MLTVEFVCQPDGGREYRSLLDTAFGAANFSRLDAALAYATTGGVDAILESLDPHRPSLRLRWLLAIDWCRSEPAALDLIQSESQSQVRIVDGTHVVRQPGCVPRVPFHPKAVVLRGQGSLGVVTGSGNASRNGMTRGCEVGNVLVVENPEGFQNVGSCCGSVFVDESAEQIVAFDRRCTWAVAAADRFRRHERECPVRALAVVVGQIGGKHLLELATSADQQPVETLGSDGADESFGVGVRLWRADRCSDDPDPFALEDLVEGRAELAVAVVDQEPCLLQDTTEAEVARLLGDPAAGRIRRAAGEVNAAARELDEEENVVTAEHERLDGEEVTGERARRLLAEELRPARSRASRRGPQSRCQQ